MIGRLSGKLLAKQPPQILIDVAGVGYEVDVPMSTFCKLPAEGESVTLLTHFVVREDALLLYGFATPAEREAFRALIRISGVGPRIALALLSGLTVDQLAQAVESGEAGLLTRVPGIGKKTAERLLLVLKGKLAGAAFAACFERRARHPFGARCARLLGTRSLGRREEASRRHRSLGRHSARAQVPLALSAYFARR